MDGLALTTTATATINPSVFRFAVPSFSLPRRSTNLSSPCKPKKFLVFASKDDPNLDQWDHMELKFGRLLGEDPKLTLAKIMGRKLYPEMSNLEIEKEFNKKKGKALYSDIEEVPFDGSEERQSSDSLKGLNLVRPVPKKGVKFEANDKPKVLDVKRPSQPVVKAVDNTRGSIPNVILRRPGMFREDDDQTEKPSSLRIKTNLSLKMGREQTNGRLSDMTLVRRPEPINVSLDKRKEPSDDAEAKISNDIGENGLKSASVSTGTTSDVTLLEKPGMMKLDLNIDQEQEASRDHTGSSFGNEVTEKSLRSTGLSTKMVNLTKINLDQSLETRNITFLRDHEQENDPLTGLQPLKQSDIGFAEKSPATNEASKTSLADYSTRMSVEAVLQGKPDRLDQSVKETSNISGEELIPVNRESYGTAIELENFPVTSTIKECENTDWTRAEDLVKTGGREEVELINSSTRGFVVSFGSLIGFLPYRNLAAKWKFLAFESWLRRKGLDPSLYKQSLGNIGSYETTSKTISLDSSLAPKIDPKVEGEISPDMKLKDLLMMYDQEKHEFLSSFIGQKIKVNVVLTDRKSRRLIFSVRPKEKEELVEKKRSLMAKLSIGDVVKCCIKKITYFGIFVEVEGVPALIHQTEVSWDATLDPLSFYKIGQIVEAKVHQVDFSLERIFLSLKEITPDPLIEALEAIVGDHGSLDGRLEAAQADTEWPDVELLIKELQQFEGIESVSKGCFFLSPGLAPTFQVYMASMFENQYKLLARSENRVQEVMVQTTLGKEEMKSAILTCTNRVE